eukprot:416816-Amphidinium_carterae.1
MALSSLDGRPAFFMACIHLYKGDRNALRCGVIPVYQANTPSMCLRGLMWIAFPSATLERKATTWGSLSAWG